MPGDVVAYRGRDGLAGGLLPGVLQGGMPSWRVSRARCRGAGPVIGLGN
ncbi:MAG TPA: hypothetical protein VMU94_16170 [Streptosporangiaceae bacterium]|nr:hypothetical protein [Streptosporangiaceae bacterium]